MSFEKKELKKNKKELAKQAYLLLATGVVLMLGICLLLFWVIGRTSIYIPDEEKMTVRDHKFDVEVVKIERGYLTVSGWSVVLEEDIIVNNTRILLYNQVEDTYRLIPTEMVIRGDVTEMLYDPRRSVNYNYDNSGWLGRVSMNRLCEEISRYQIVILYQNNEDYFVIETGKYLEDSL